MATIQAYKSVRNDFTSPYVNTADMVDAGGGPYSGQYAFWDDLTRTYTVGSDQEIDLAAELAANAAVDAANPPGSNTWWLRRNYRPGIYATFNFEVAKVRGRQAAGAGWRVLLLTFDETDDVIETGHFEYTDTLGLRLLRCHVESIAAGAGA